MEWKLRKNQENLFDEELYLFSYFSIFLWTYDCDQQFLMFHHGTKNYLPLNLSITHANFLSLALFPSLCLSLSLPLYYLFFSLYLSISLLSLSLSLSRCFSISLSDRLFFLYLSYILPLFISRFRFNNKWVCSILLCTYVCCRTELVLTANILSEHNI